MECISCVMLPILWVGKIFESQFLTCKVGGIIIPTSQGRWEDSMKEKCLKVLGTWVFKNRSVHLPFFSSFLCPNPINLPMHTHGTSVFYSLPFTRKTTDEMRTCLSLPCCWSKLWFTNETLCLTGRLRGQGLPQTPLSAGRLHREEALVTWFGRRFFLFETLPNFSFSGFPQSYEMWSSVSRIHCFRALNQMFSVCLIIQTALTCL